MHLKLVLNVVTFIVLLLTSISSLSAQDSIYKIKNYELPSISQAARIDGVMDEPQWQEALKLDLIYETSPDENTPAKQKTTAYLYENGESLYVAFRAEDSDMSQLRAFIKDRDSAYQDDFVGIQMDTFNDEQRAYEFFVNPYGSQMDLLYDESSDDDDDSWDAIWDAQGSIDEGGYTIEMEIPFSNLRFESSSDVKTWGIEVLRVHPRDQRRIYRNSPRNRNRNCILCQFHKLKGFQNAKQGNQLELNPVLTIGKSESRNDAGELVTNSTDYEPGLNVRWGITPELTLDGTLNPDFSQVESDSAQLSVNETFALFFPEKRPFFQEGSNYYNTHMNVIYTRNVTDPEYGLKLTGRQNSHTFGAFAVKDEITNIILPGTFGSSFTSLGAESDVYAGRYRYDFNPDLNIGLIGTYRDSGDYNNTVTGVDGFYRWKEKHTFRAIYLNSNTDNTLAMQDEFGLAAKQSGHAYRLNYRYNSRDWFAFSNYRDYDKDFRADLGFITRVNNDQFAIGGGRVLYSEDKWWNRIEIGGDWDISHDNEGRLLEKELEGRIEINGPLQSYISTGMVARDRLFEDTLFYEKFNWAYFEIKPIGGLVIGFETNIGDRIDFSESKLADSFRLQPFINFDLNKHLNLNIKHTYNRLDSDGGRKLTANLTDARIKYQFSTRSFLRLTLQYENIESIDQDRLNFGEETGNKGLNSQLLYSYKVNPRTVFFLGYSDLSDDANTERSLQTQERGLFMKLGYVFDY
ncbi:MAG: carbohydrate binding family 9 domain-containing protein [Gammaproteobacteria bacterium]|nr:carbohydrate binding family 9 domain-containing protein [Gammaproteobacteria bacterium]NNC97011.1 carbohydrate binding family 9 domain-containing protein [Gammaproteobacteria bacterium]